MTRDGRARSWKFVGGRLCLDFVNTVGGRVSRSGAARSPDFADQIVRDKLTVYPDLVAWSQAAGVLGPREAKRLLRLAKDRPREAAAVQARGLSLREAIHRLVKAALHGWEPLAEDLEILNGEVETARRRERVVAARGGFVWASSVGKPALDGPVSRVASSAADLLTSADLVRVRRCGGEECGWLFLDESRNRSRQWCDMRDCGNLAKVRRFRERHRSDD